MRIVDHELYPVPPSWLFLDLETSDGVVGRGEPIVEGRTRSVRPRRAMGLESGRRV